MNKFWAICDPNNNNKIIHASIHTITTIFMPLIFKTKKEAQIFVNMNNVHWTGVYKECYIKKFYSKEAI